MVKTGRIMKNKKKKINSCKNVKKKNNNRKTDQTNKLLTFSIPFNTI